MREREELERAARNIETLNLNADEVGAEHYQSVKDTLDWVLDPLLNGVAMFRMAPGTELPDGTCIPR